MSRRPQEAVVVAGPELKSGSNSETHTMEPIYKTNFRKNRDYKYRKITGKSVQEDKFENKIFLAPKISQNCPVRRRYFIYRLL